MLLPGFWLMILFAMGCTAHWDNDISLNTGNSIYLATDEFQTLEMSVRGTTYVPFVSMGPMTITEIKSATCVSHTICKTIELAHPQHNSAKIGILPLKSGNSALHIKAWHPYRKRLETIDAQVTVVPPPTTGLQIGDNLDISVPLRLHYNGNMLHCRIHGFDYDVLIKYYFPLPGRDDRDVFYGCFHKDPVTGKEQRYDLQRHDASLILCIARNATIDVVAGYSLWQSLGEKLAPKILQTKGTFNKGSCSLDGLKDPTPAP